MPCSTCRKPPRVVRRPSVTNPNSNVVKSTTKNNTGSGDQRSRVTGLTYAPKG